MKAKNVTRKIYLLFVIAFMFVTIFDPADVVLGLKVPLFILCFISGGLVLIARSGRTFIPTDLIIYTLLFVAIPLFSILVYFMKTGTDPYEGFNMLKAYLFIFFAIILVSTNIDVTKYLSGILSFMSVCIIFLFIFLLIYPDYFIIANALGAATEIFYVDMRSYDGITSFQQAYFVCSPMLVIPVSYYYFRFRESHNKDLWALFLMILSFTGLLMAGSRNNLFAAIFLIPTLYIIFNRKKILPIILVSSMSAILVSYFTYELVSFFDPNEAGNNVKLSYIPDYAEIFSDLNNFFFGQGLGAYYKFTSISNPYFVTELTYFEVIRNFGLFLGFMMLIMLAYPIFKTFQLGKNAALQKHIAVAYAFYLVMCFTNPNLFSSMGILILCIVLSGLYKKKYNTYNDTKINCN